MNGALQPNLATYFLDENLEGKTLEGLLRARGVQVVAHRELYSTGEPDEDWIPKVSKTGYVVVTKDVTIKTKATQRSLVMKHQATFLFFRVQMARTEETAELLIRHYDAVCQHVRKLAPPIMLAITKGGLTKEHGDRRGGVKK